MAGIQGYLAVTWALSHLGLCEDCGTVLICLGPDPLSNSRTAFALWLPRCESSDWRLFSQNRDLNNACSLVVTLPGQSLWAWFHYRWLVRPGSGYSHARTAPQPPAKKTQKTMLSTFRRQHRLVPGRSGLVLTSSLPGNVKPGCQ